MKVVDLFSGVGGLSLGFKEAGYDVSASFDSWEKAVSIYRKNFSHDSYVLDLSDTDKAIQEISKLGVDAVIGGPPCQDFSHAGKRQEGGRANLTQSFAKIVASVSPKLFVMENVDRARKSEAYQNARAIFKESGYGLTEVVLDASLCGVPQKRKRFFCIGIKGKSDGFLLETIERSMSPSSMTVRDYLGDELKTDHYYRHPRNYNRRGIFSIDEPAPTIRGVNRPIPPNYPRHNGDTCDPSEARSLTTAERARLQTFPNSFEWEGTKTDLEQMIGNAVPVNLAKFVAKALKTYIAENG